MTPEQIAQWIIDNRYPKSEHEKIADSEMYNTIVENINQLLIEEDKKQSKPPSIVDR